MSTSPLHSVSVAGVTFDDAGRVLVIKRRDNGQWQAPGGVLELNETFEQGVAREVLEETGVDVQVDYLTGVYKNMSAGVVSLVFRCHVIHGRPRESVESVAAEWLTVSEAIKRMTPAFGVRVHDADDLSGEPKLRAHDGVNLL